MKWAYGYLKLCTVGIATLAFLLSVFGIVQLIRNPIQADERWFLYPIVIGLILSAVPLIYGMLHIYRMLQIVQRGQVDVGRLLHVLGVIRGCAYAFGSIFLVLIPFAVRLIDEVDAPGMMFIFTAPILVALVAISVIHIVQKQLKQARIEL